MRGRRRTEGLQELGEHILLVDVISVLKNFNYYQYPEIGEDVSVIFFDCGIPRASTMPSAYGGIIPLTLQTSLRLFSASVINSTCKLQCR
jgi:hypothetical protein